MNSKMPNIKQILTFVAVASAGVFLYLPASALMNSNASDSQQLAQTTPLPTDPTPPSLPTPTPLTPPGGSLSTPLPSPTLETSPSPLPEGGGNLPDATPSPTDSPEPLPTPEESPTPESTPDSQGGGTQESAPSTGVTEPAPSLSPGLGTSPAASDLQPGSFACLNNPNPACKPK